jgi:anti-sigma-K factor RskA
LTNIGLNPTAVTPFTDSAEIDEWYMREVSVAQSLGLIAPDANGRIYPDRAITKGEAASLLNVFIEFMRNGFMSEYVDQIVNFAS